MLIGQLLNIGVPARVGDVARVYLIGEAGGFSKTRAATSLIVEKFFDLSTFLVMLLLISLRVYRTRFPGHTLVLCRLA